MNFFRFKMLPSVKMSELTKNRPVKTVIFFSVLNGIRIKELEMSSFLSKKKDDTSFDDMLFTAPESTQINKRYAVKLFEKFVDVSYQGRTPQDVIDELLLIKSQDSQTYEDALYGMLQDWINWNQKNGRCNSNNYYRFQ